MPNLTRRLVLTTVLSAVFLAGAALAYPQVAAPVPVVPVVLSGGDLGFRQTGHKRGTPVGQLVVRVNGEWKEVEFSYAVKLLTK